MVKKFSDNDPTTHPSNPFYFIYDSLCSKKCINQAKHIFTIIHEDFKFIVYENKLKISIRYTFIIIFIFF